jgi:hypothetical protein
MTWFLYDGMSMSSLDAIIKEVVISRLWSSEIDSVSTVIYLQPSDFQKFTVYETQHKNLSTLDIIGDVISKEKISASNSEFRYVHYFQQYLFRATLYRDIV